MKPYRRWIIRTLLILCVKLGAEKLTLSGFSLPGWNCDAIRIP